MTMRAILLLIALATSSIARAAGLSFPGIDVPALEAALASKIPIDLSSLVQPGTLVIDDFCYQDSIFGCVGRVDAVISNDPAPFLGDISADISFVGDNTVVDLSLSDLQFRGHVTAVTGIGFSCGVDITFPSYLALIDLHASSSSSPFVPDAVQTGSVVIVSGYVNDDSDCGGFLGGIDEFFVGLFFHDLVDILVPALEDYFNDLDENGNSVVAAAYEQAALEQIQGVPGSGDVNYDGVVGISDMLLMQRAILGLTSLDINQISRGDLSPDGGDGLISISDMLLLQQLIAQ